MAGSWRDRKFHARSSASFGFRPSSLLFYSILVLLAIFTVALFLSQRQISAVDRDPFSRTEHFQVSEKQLWGSSLEYGYHSCVKPTSTYSAPQDRDRYITVRSNGGLNQMRTGISDMVAVTRLMNATLVIPQLDKRSFWQDSSIFEDIFDETYFIETLKGDIRVVRELPKELESAPRARKHFTSWSGAGYYKEIAQLFKDYKVIHVPKSDSRLANNDLPLDIQKLRCRTLYQALRFASPIEALGKAPHKTKAKCKRFITRMVRPGDKFEKVPGSNICSEPRKPLTGQKLVARLQSKGRYIALHLRYEKDMLSFTGCTYGLTDQEAEELKVMRKNTNHWKMKDINLTEQRISGFCPLTPKEVGIFLKSVGYPKSTWIYLAAGEIYGGDTYLSDLRSRFPNLVTKEMLVGKKELEKFMKHASQAAALDYIISVESDVFVPSYTGNMARAVEGHRRFLGHRKTISPDRKGLVELFDLIEKGEMEEGPMLSSLVSQMHKYRQGAPRKRYGSSPGSKGRARLRTEESFYENPLPECICLTGKH